MKMALTISEDEDPREVRREEVEEVSVEGVAKEVPVRQVVALPATPVPATLRRGRWGHREHTYGDESE